MRAIRELYPNHEAQLARLARIEGQLRGVRKMIEERRYCIDIVSQIKAVTAGLKQVQMGVLEKHIHHCVRESVESHDPDLLEQKITEIVQVLGKMD
ncbi:MAG TPA: metal-sensitive transcriptional regulator [bacterium]|nr:metal-sensitive transcriptional regulator [bacterium]